ncbi:SGNH hydrolase [Glarea lozoyensis ATCC 20868]|uniref:SGNH hydrolase n=1 Tax=Glarea lozoyensis (strain ATCC 20868 / MF5171) TaxID=1116229 RepID=S3D588_GLAL2|nr:SGNH hydrolase [Glarea lozoyensis ATCC 20868]EPE33632.1 SGNH hydrolase [Glarea lozoyensis ATCC 20868]
MSPFLRTLSILALIILSSIDAYYIIPPNETLFASTPTLHERAEIAAAPIGKCVPVGSVFPSDVTLRILPLGASIVFGYASTDKNGFRAALRSQLVANGASVNFVGELQSGTMIDNDVSGFIGARLDQVFTPLEHALPWLPNIILINVGSNDAGQSYDIVNYHVRLAALLDRIIKTLPKTVILLSNILPNRTPETEANVKIINAQFAAVIQERIDKGALIHFVDMHSLMSPSDIGDGTHPSDAGYIKMGGIWYSAIQQAFAKCWITPPGFVASINDTVPGAISNTICENVLGNAVGPVTVQQGSGNDDSVYVHQGEGLGIAQIDIPSDGLGYDPARVYWADINGALGVALSDGSGANGFGGPGGFLNYAIPMPSCSGVTWFKDIDGDGRDDYICVAPDGKLSAWRNTPGPNPRQPTVRSTQGSTVIIADIDGDGKDDYLTVSSDGSIRASRNGGVGIPTYWQDLGVVFNEGGGRDWRGFQLTDINGDGRDDVVWTSDKGEVTTWTNLRGHSVNSLVPVWRAAGVTHFGDPLLTQYPKPLSKLIFGNVKGHKEWVTYPNYQGVGNDYTVAYQIGPSGAYKLRVTLWFNSGTGGGTRQAGDGVRYCDMRGKGSDDYIWMAKDGTLTVFGNYNNPPNWLQYGVVYTPGSLMAGHTRKDVHLADLNGDGKCDFLIVDKASGSVRMIRNDYSAATDKFAWTDMGIVFDGGGCKNHYGVGLFDMGVRFADITGNGFPDYLCIDPDGRTDAWINTNIVFRAMGQAKASAGADRANIRWADVNGDGKADYIWIDEFLGTYQYWTNAGPGNPADNLGSHIHWDARGVSGGGGNLRGECLDFSDGLCLLEFVPGEWASTADDGSATPSFVGINE